MRNKRILLTSVAVVLATITAASAPAHAGKRLLILIDASGSMVASRNNQCNPAPPNGQPCDRFFGAKTAATNAINGIGDPALLTAIYTFHDTTTLIPAKRAHGAEGFIDFNSALDEVEALSTLADVGGGTPLAGAMCQAIDTLQAQHTLFPNDQLLILVLSDGEENATPDGTLCHGDLFTDPVTSDDQYPANSWQRKVLDHLPATIVPQAALFSTSQVRFATQAGDTVDPEGILSPQTRSLATAASISTGLSPFEQFFVFFTQKNGGHVTIIHDDEPLPVTGDLNGDRCVDRADAILVARSFGPIVPPVDGQADLNFDRTVDFADYLIQVGRITPACGPDPYVRRDPVTCRGAQRVVIDGQVIEDGGLTIDARGACEITIKNSLIVSGKNAIKIVGSASITVENSIIVGQDAVITQHGSGVLSAANSVFHGKLDTHGAFQYIDRGGNVFE